MNRHHLGILLLVSGLIMGCVSGGPPPEVKSRQVLNADGSLLLDFTATAETFGDATELAFRHTVYDGGTALSPQMGFARHDTAVGSFQAYDLSGGGTLFVGGTYQQPAFYYMGGGPSVTLRLCSEADDTRGIRTPERCQTLALAELTDLTALTVYAVRVSVTDLDGTLTLQNNGGDGLVANAAGTHTFTTRLAPRASYAVSVASLAGENYYQACTMTGGSGTIGHTDVTVSVNCPEPFVIGRGNLMNGTLSLQGVTTDAAGSIYAASGVNSIVKYNSAGYLVLEFSASAAGDTQTPGLRDVALDSDHNIYVVDAANQCIKVFNAAGTYLRKFGTSGSGNGQFNSPSGIFIDASDTVYVVEIQNHRVQVFDRNGTYLRKFGSFGVGNGQFRYPRKLWVDSSGKIYVADAGNNRIQVFNNAGSFLLKFGSSGSGNGQFIIVEGVAVAANGNIYTSDSSRKIVQVFDSNGNYLSRFATGTGYAAPDLQSPFDIHIDQDGNIVIADYTLGLKKFTAGGALLQSIQGHGQGDGEFNGSNFVAVDSTRVVVADSLNNRIQVFDREGRFVRKFGTYGAANGQFSYPAGIDFDSQGRFYVVDSGNSRVQVFDAQGNYLLQFGEWGWGDGQFSWPSGIAVNSNGNILVLDTDRSDVQVFGPSGSFISKFGAMGSDNGQFLFPTDLALFQNGDIAVADDGNSRVQIFDGSGNYLRQFGSSGSGDGEFGFLAGIDVGSDHRIYVSDSGNGRIQVFDQNGNFLHKFGSFGNRPGALGSPADIAVSPEADRIFVADYFTHKVQVFDMQGNSIMH